MESQHDKLVFYISFFSNMWVEHKMTFIYLVLSAILFLCILYMLIISPLIFNFFIVPNIEHKTGRKIGHRIIDEYMWLGKWTNRQNWTAIYIVNRYYAWKFKKDYGLPTARYFNSFPLKLIGYTIDRMSKTEIFFSFLLVTVLIIVALLMLLLGAGLFFKPFIMAH